MFLFELKIKVTGEGPDKDSDFDHLADQWQEFVQEHAEDLVRQFCEDNGFEWESNG